jgi:hypothetical protein
MMAMAMAMMMMMMMYMMLHKNDEIEKLFFDEWWS